MEDFSIIIAGSAGDGIKASGKVIAELFARLGYYVFVHFEYQSLIRGGYNAGIVRVASEEVRCHRERAEILIAISSTALERYSPMAEKVVADSSFYSGKLSLPITQIARKLKAPGSFKNAVAVGALCYMFGVDISNLEEIYREWYGKKAELDIELAEMGYSHARENFPVILRAKRIASPRKIFSGNQLIALGGVKAGLKNYYAYPMTPSTSILHYLAKNSEKFGVTVVQPENEIAAAVMAIGSAYAGARTMVGTSGGGFALMQEAVSLAGMAEVPVLFVESQRQSPSTGMPTWHSQSDLHFVLNSGHGEFPRIVASPGDIEDAFYLTGELLNLCWKFQTPAVLLTDRYLSESLATCQIEEDRISEQPPLVYTGNLEEYKRYALTEDGISPLAFPPSAIVRATGNEHTEEGFTTDEADIGAEMYAKRMRKEKKLREEVQKLGGVRVFGSGEDVVFTWSSTTGVVREVAERLGLKVMQIRYLSPFPVEEIQHSGIARAAVVECNYTSQLGRLLREKAGINATPVVKWNGRAFSLEELEQRLGEVFS